MFSPLHFDLNSIKCKREIKKVFSHHHEYFAGKKINNCVLFKINNSF